MENLVKCDLALKGDGDTLGPIYRGKGCIHVNGWVEFRSEQDPVIIGSTFYPPQMVVYIRFLKGE